MCAFKHDPSKRAKGRDDFRHVLQQPHRTEIRMVTERVVLTEVQKGSTPNLLVKSVRESEQTTFHKLLKRKLPKRTFL